MSSLAARRAALRARTATTPEAPRLVEAAAPAVVEPSPAPAADREALPAPAPAAVLSPLDLDGPLKGCPVAVIDVETTGIDVAEARIVEVAVVVIDRLGETDPVVAFSTRVNPGVPIPPDATKVHGIGDADVAEAPTWDEVYPRIREATAGRVLAAFNCVYDYQVIGAECDRHAGPGRLPERTGPRKSGAPEWLDPFILGRLVDKFAKGKRLADIAGRRGIEVDAHGAAGDAMVTAMLLPTLLGEAARLVDRRGSAVEGRPSPSDLASIRSYLAWQRDAALAQERDLVAFRQGQETECPWHRLEGVEPPAMQRRAVSGAAATCADCGEPIGWAVRRGGKREATEPGTTELHRCLLRVVTAPIFEASERVVIETAEGVVIRGYRVPAEYQPHGLQEVVFTGRVARPDEKKPEALEQREEGRR